MFGNRKAVEVTTAVRAENHPVLVMPVGVKVTTLPMSDNELAVYKKVCKAIGFEPAALLRARILAFFKEKGIRIFDYDQVAAFMKTKAENERKIWFWRPLREADAIENWGWNNGWNRNTDSYNHDYYSSKRWECRSYHREVPLRVLARVEQIHQEFGDKVKFFVTDYAVPGPDPFIAVTALDMGRIIFDCWDEPDFAAKSAIEE